jgi:hypothetical protein
MIVAKIAQNVQTSEVRRLGSSNYSCLISSTVCTLTVSTVSYLYFGKSLSVQVSEPRSRFFRLLTLLVLGAGIM